MVPKASILKEYHRSAMSAVRDFTVRYEDPSLSVATMLDSQVQRTMDSNLKVIESLFKVAILCGKQGLAINAEDDRVQWEDEDESLKRTLFSWSGFVPRLIKF